VWSACQISLGRSASRRIHGQTKMPPADRWEKGAFLPQKPRRQPSHRLINDVIAWGSAADIHSYLTNPPVYRGNWHRRRLQRQGFRYFKKLWWQCPSLAAVFAWLSGKSRQTELAVAAYPSVYGPIWDSCLLGDDA
jgi:hypothetical protein